MITPGMRVRVLEITDYLLQEGVVTKVRNNVATVKFPRATREFKYNVDDLEQVAAQPPQKLRKSLSK